MADDQQQPTGADDYEATVTNPDVDPDKPQGQNFTVGGPLQSPPPADDGSAFHPQEGGTTQGGERISAATRRFIDARDHVQNCAEEKSLRDRTGVCTECGATVSYGQTECPHAVLVLGTCANCGTNYDRAGWTNKPTELTAAAEDQGDAAAPANQEA